MTGLPMVFAVWAGRKGCVTPELAPEFLDSCRYGLAHIDEIARTHAVERGLPEALIHEYFARNVSLLLGEREYAGLELFLRYAREIGVGRPAARVLV